MSASVDALRKAAVFGGFSEVALAFLAGAAEFRSLSPGDLVFEEGSLGQELFVVESGLFEAITAGAVRLSAMAPGEAFGELSLIERRRRSATVRAVDSSRLLALPKSAFDELAVRFPRDHHRFAMHLARETSRRLRERGRALADFTAAEESTE